MRDEATRNLYPQVIRWDEKYGSFDKDGNKVSIDEKKVDEEEKKLRAEYDAQEYARKRYRDYPDLREQLDYIYHNGIAKWKTNVIDPVKDKYPKPE